MKCLHVFNGSSDNIIYLIFIWSTTKEISKALDKSHIVIIIIVTEEEVEKGILQASNPGSHSECFIRKLTGISQDQLSDTNATRYFETVKCNGMVR